MSRARGFTLIELMVSIVILAVGLMALGASTTMISRTLNGAKAATAATQVAQRRVDMLRAASAATTTKCTDASFASGGPVQTQPGISESWVVPASGTSRTVLVIVGYRVTVGRVKTDTLATNIQC